MERKEENVPAVVPPDTADVPKPALTLPTKKARRIWRGAAAQFKAMKEAFDTKVTVEGVGVVEVPSAAKEDGGRADPESSAGEAERQLFLKKRLERTLLGLKAEVALEDIIKKGEELEAIAAQKASSSKEVEPTFSTEELEMYHKRLADLKTRSPTTKASTSSQTKEKGKGKGNSRKGKKREWLQRRRARNPTLAMWWSLLSIHMPQWSRMQKTYKMCQTTQT